MFTRFARTRLFSLALPVGGLIAGSTPLLYSNVNPRVEVAPVSVPAAASAESIVEYYPASLLGYSAALDQGMAAALAAASAETAAPPLADARAEAAPAVSAAVSPAVSAAEPAAPKPSEPVRTASLEDATLPASALPAVHAAPLYTVVVENAKAPKGWSEFCKHYARECEVRADKPQDIHLTSEVWDTLVAVNSSVNRDVRPMTDKRHWGRVNKWTYAEDGYGDCKDYVLVKQRRLIEAGLPRGSLLVTIVWTKQNQGHAVLIVRTDKGDYVLDNLSRQVLLWTKTSHDYVKRQSQTNPNAWVYIDGNPKKTAVTLASKAK